MAFRRLLFLFFITLTMNLLATTNIDITKPIKIEADEVKIQKNKNIVDFIGKVKAKQEKLTIFSDRMIVKYQKNDKNKATIKNIKVLGNVIMKNEDITAKGDNAVYDFKNQIITLKDNIILNEKDAVLMGDILTYNIITKETDIKSKDEKSKEAENIIEKEDNNHNKKGL